MQMHGALVVHKPAELTSSDCVTRLKWAFVNHGYHDKKIRIGHGGTLDPFATGVLIVLFGEATKLADTYLHSKKNYSGLIQLGTQTDTADLTGESIASEAVPSLTETQWNTLAQQFVDADYFQTPPMYSAKKKNGIAFHELARKGIEIERESILKKIYSYQIKKITEDQLTFEVECESGTYVRTLAEDLAKKAGTLAHLKTLCRSRSSDCSLNESLPLDTLLTFISNKTPLEMITAYRPLHSLASHLSKVSVTEMEARDIRTGKTQVCNMLCARTSEQFPTHPYILATLGSGPEAEIIALLSRKPTEHFRLQRVFNSLS